MTQPEQTFESAMRTAQLMHSNSSWQDATKVWSLASTMAPDESERLRAMRGEAVSSFRLAETTGDSRGMSASIALAGVTVIGHGRLVREAEASRDTKPNHYDQHAESARVYGRMMLKLALSRERAGEIDEISYTIASRALRDAYVSALVARVKQYKSGEPLPLTQHYINLLPDLVFTESFLPQSDQPSAADNKSLAPDTDDVPSASEMPQANRSGAKISAREARRLAWRSESPSLATPANLGWKHRLKAVGKSPYRAYAASSANVLTKRPFRMRTIARRIAALPGVL